MSYRAGEYTHILDVLLEEDEVALIPDTDSVTAWWQGHRGDGRTYREALRKLAVAIVTEEVDTKLSYRLATVCTAAGNAHRKALKEQSDA